MKTKLTKLLNDNLNLRIKYTDEQTTISWAEGFQTAYNAYNYNRPRIFALTEYDENQKGMLLSVINENGRVLWERKTIKKN